MPIKLFLVAIGMQKESVCGRLCPSTFIDCLIALQFVMAFHVVNPSVSLSNCAMSSLDQPEQKVVDSNDYPAFVVDKVCTEPTFMDKMGNDPNDGYLFVGQHQSESNLGMLH